MRLCSRLSWRLNFRTLSTGIQVFSPQRQELAGDDCDGQYGDDGVLAHQDDGKGVRSLLPVADPAPPKDKRHLRILLCQSRRRNDGQGAGEVFPVSDDVFFCACVLRSIGST